MGQEREQFQTGREGEDRQERYTGGQGEGGYPKKNGQLLVGGKKIWTWL